MISIFGFILLFSIGYLFAGIFLPRSDFWERVSLSFGLGVGIITLLMFLISIAGIHLNKAVLLLLELSILSALIARIRMARLSLFLKPHLPNFNNLGLSGYLLWAAIICLVALSVAYNLYYPVYITDGLTTWDTKGRAIAAEGKVNVEGFTLNLFNAREYPLLIPLAHAFVYILGGKHPKIIYSLFYLSLILTFYFSLRKLIKDSKIAMIFTAMLATTPYIWWHSFLSIANLPTGYFYFAGTVLLLAALDSEPNGGNKALSPRPWTLDFGLRTLVLSSLFYGFAAWTRLEFSYYFLLPLAFVVWRAFGERSWWKVPLFVVPFLAAASPWIIYRYIKWPEWSVPGQIGPVEKVLDFSFRPDILWVTIEHTILIQIFAAASCLLFLLVPLLWRSNKSKNSSYVLPLIGGYFLMHILLHCIISYRRELYYHVYFLDLMGEYLHRPGVFISYSPVREFITVFFPMFLFSIGVCSNRISGIGK